MKERIIQELMESISAAEGAIYGIPGAAERIDAMVHGLYDINIYALQERIKNLQELIRLKDELIDHLAAFHDAALSPAVKVVYSAWDEYYETLLRKIKKLQS